MAIQETKETIAQQQARLAEARQQAEAFTPKILQSREQLARATMQTQAQIRSAEFERQVLKQRAISEISQAQQQLSEQTQTFEEYLKTPEGIKAYAREFNIRPVERYETYVLGDQEARVRILTYKTPHGVYEDRSELERLQRRAELEADIRTSTPAQIAARYSTPKTYLTNLASLEKYKQSINQQNKFTEMGVTPIIQNNQIIGFQDDVAGMSYAVENIPIERIPDFQRQGLIRVEQIRTKTPTQEFYEKVSQPQVNILTSQPYEQPQKTRISLPYQTRGTAFYGTQGYYAPATILDAPKPASSIEYIEKRFVTPAQERAKLKYAAKEGSPTRFLYGTGEEMPRKPRIPYGLEAKPEYISGEEFSPFYFHTYIGTQAAKKLGIKGDLPIWLQKVEKTARPIVAEAPKVFFFSPAMQTAAAKKGAKAKTATKQASKKAAEKVAKKLEKIIKESKSKAEAQSRITQYAKQYKEAALKQGMNPSEVNANLREMFQFSQKRGLFDLDDISRNSIYYNENLARTFTMEVDISAFSTNLPPTLQKLPQIELGTGLITTRPEFKAFEQQTGIFKPNLQTKESVLAVTTTAPILKVRQIPKEKLKLKTQQAQVPATASVTLPKIATSQISPLQTGQQVKQVPQQVPQTVYRQPARTKLVPKKPISPTPFVPKPTGTTLLKSAAKKLKKRRSDFDIYVRRKGKDIKVGTQKTPRQAGLFLGKGLKQTLAASGLVIERGTGRKVSLKELGLSMEFRPSKVDPFRVVQRRKFRLGTFGEVVEIQKAKKRKPKDDFFDFIGGRKKKRKMKKIGWFK